MFYNINCIKFNIINFLYIFRFSSLFNKFIYINAQLFFFGFNKYKKNYKPKRNNIFLLAKPRSAALLSKFRRIYKNSISEKKKKILNLVLIRKRSLFKRKYNFKRMLFRNNYKRIKKTINLRKKFYFFRNYKKKKLYLRRKLRKLSFFKKTKSLSFFSKNIIQFKKKKRNRRKRRVFINVFRRFIKNLKINRELIKEIFFTKFTKQHKLTNFFKKFTRTRNTNVVLILQSFLYVVLLNCQLFKFKLDVFFFLKKFGVYVNGVPCFNPYKLLVTNDVVQLPVVDTFFYFYKKQESMSIFFYIKYRKKYNKIYAAKNIRWYYRSKKIPSWVYKLIYFNSDIPACYEIDYTILTIFVLNIRNLHYSAFFFKKYISLCFIRMYNWRKIT